MRIATLEDAQALSDYWGANLADIQGDAPEAGILPPGQIAQFISAGITAFDATEGLCAAIRVTEFGRPILRIGLWHGQNAAGFAFALSALVDEAIRVGDETITGVVHPGSFADAWLASKNISSTTEHNGDIRYTDLTTTVKAKISG